MTKVGLPTCGANTFLSWNGSALSCQPISGVAGGTVTSITAGAGLTGGTITSAGTIGLDTELSGLNSLSTTGFVKRTGAGVYSTAPINLSSDISGTLPVVNGGTGLTSLGVSNQVLGVNNAGTAAEYKTITAGTGITVSHSAGAITINATGGNAITALTGDVTATGPGSVAASISSGAVTTPKLFANPGINRLVATDSSTGATLAPLSCAAGQLLSWNVSTGWQCTNASSLSTGSFSGSLSGDVTGSQSATVVSSVGDVSAANVASGANAANSATSVNTASTLVSRDASGNFSAGNITANLTGSVTGASSLNVLKAGDTMTGALNLPTDGLVVGTSQLVASGGKVGIGTISPNSPLTISSAVSSASAISIQTYNNNATQSFVQHQRARGTAAAPSPTLLGDLLGAFLSTGYNSSGWNVGSAGIQVVATENSTNTAQGSRLELFSTKNGTTTPLTALVVDNTGYVGIGTASPSATLDVNGTMKSSNSWAQTNSSSNFTFSGTISSLTVQCHGGPILIFANFGASNGSNGWDATTFAIRVGSATGTVIRTVANTSNDIGAVGAFMSTVQTLYNCPAGSTTFFLTGVTNPGVTIYISNLEFSAAELGLR